MGDLQMGPLMEEKKKREIKTGFGEQEEAELSPYALDERWRAPEQQQQTQQESYGETRLVTESVSELLADTDTTQEMTLEKKGPMPLFDEGEPNLQDIRRKQDSRNASMLLVLAEIMKVYPAFVSHELLEEDKSNPSRVFVTLHDPSGNKVKLSVMKQKNEGDKRALWVQLVEKAVKMLMGRYEGGAMQDMYAGLSDTNKLSSEERKAAAGGLSDSEMKAGVMLFMGKRGFSIMGLDNNDDNKEEGDGSVLVYNSAPAPSVPTA